MRSSDTVNLQGDNIMVEPKTLEHAWCRGRLFCTYYKGRLHLGYFTPYLLAAHWWLLNSPFLNIKRVTLLATESEWVKLKTVRQIDMTKLIVAFCNSANAPKSSKNQLQALQVLKTLHRWHARPFWQYHISEIQPKWYKDRLRNMYHPALKSSYFT